MIVIFSNEHLAIALWDSAEKRFGFEQATEHGNRYQEVPWERAHEMDKQDYRDMAKEIVANCLRQAKAQISPRTSSATSAPSSSQSPTQPRPSSPSTPLTDVNTPGS
jgi:hypothetical protein